MSTKEKNRHGGQRYGRGRPRSTERGREDRKNGRAIFLPRPRLGPVRRRLGVYTFCGRHDACAKQPLQTTQGAASGSCPAVLWPSFRAESAEPRNPGSAPHTDHCCDSSMTFARHPVLTRVRDKDRCASSVQQQTVLHSPSIIAQQPLPGFLGCARNDGPGHGSNTQEPCRSNADGRHCIAQSDSLCLRRNVETPGKGFQACW